MKAFKATGKPGEIVANGIDNQVILFKKNKQTVEQERGAIFLSAAIAFGFYILYFGARIYYLNLF